MCEREPLSDNMETVFDLDILLEDLILGKLEFEENRREKGKEQTGREQQFTAFRVTIFQLAISRKRRSIDIEDFTENYTPRKNAKSSSMCALKDDYLHGGERHTVEGERRKEDVARRTAVLGPQRSCEQGG